jgi:hypothetical protein
MKPNRVFSVALLCAGMCSSAHAQDAAPPAPKANITLINLHMKDAVAQDVFDELAKQSGIKFSTNGDIWDQPAMQDQNDVDLTDRPFWSAVNEMCVLWGVSIQPSMNNFGNPNTKRIQLNPAFGNGPKNKAPVFQSDGFLVRADSFNRQQSINYSAPDQSQNFCSVQVTVFVDPSIHLSSFNQNAKVDTAVDDASNSMLPTRSNNVFYGGGQQRSMIYTCTVPLKYPDQPGKKIAHLKFTLSMRGSDSMDSLSVDKPLDAQETSKDFGATTVTFHSMKKNAQGMYEVKVGVSQDNDQGGNNAWNLLQSAQLLDGKGHSFVYTGGGGGGGGPTDMAEYTVNYTGNNNGQADDKSDGEPAKWILELPTKTHAIRLPVEFNDLPLP